MNLVDATTTPPKSRARWVLGLVGYVAIGVLAYRAIDPSRFLAGLARLDAKHIIVVVGVSMLHITGRALRYDWLLRRTGATGYRLVDGLRIFLVGLCASAVTPGRAGDLVKAKLVDRHGIALPVGFGLVLTERMLDLLAVAGCASVAGFLVGRGDGSTSVRDACVFFFLGLSFAVAALSVRRLRAFLVRAAATILAWVTKKPHEGFVAKLEPTFIAWDVAMTAPHRVTGALAYSCVVWIFEFTKLWLLLGFLGVPAPLTVVLFVYPVSIIAGILTLLPFSEGVVGLTGVAMLGALAGIDAGPATLAVTLDRCASVLPPIVLAAFFSSTTAARR